MLDNIRSAHNVGSIFRTADGAGVKKIYLCGYTPRPIDRFGRVQPEIKKTSLGASESMQWEAVEEADSLIDRLKDQGITVAAVEQTAASIPYANWQASGPTAFIFGNEVDGVQQTLLERADVTLEIPMRGQKESLNVGVAAGIILFHASRG